jgi:hypothetical protein
VLEVQRRDDSIVWTDLGPWPFARLAEHKIAAPAMAFTMSVRIYELSYNREMRKGATKSPLYVSDGQRGSVFHH